MLVIHEIYGLSDWVRGLADELAEAGYIAIVPNLLSGMAPGGAGGTKEIGDRDAVTRAVRSLPADQVTADLNANSGVRLETPCVQRKSGGERFLLGWRANACRYATENASIKAACVYGDAAPADRMSKISCPVYGFYGGKDGRITQTVPIAEKEMKAAGKNTSQWFTKGPATVSCASAKIRMTKCPRTRRPGNRPQAAGRLF